MPASLVWITPDAEKLVVEMARVSNPASAAKGENNERLIRYLKKHKHWSPFEMASACFKISTTRDIGRQILRHRSFSFQEFSQRYADVSVLDNAPPRETRMQDPDNRQSSLPCDDHIIADFWHREQRMLQKHAHEVYQWALKRGIAKEVARAVLPEGLTPSQMYMSGTLRSWLHFIEVRTHPGAQKEVADLANEIYRQLFEHCPETFKDIGCT